MTRFVCVVLMCLSLTGCLRVVVDSPAARSGQRDSDSGVSFVGLTTVTADARLCTHGIAKVETYMPVWGWLLGVFTGGIVPGMKAEYHCAAPTSLAERDALRAAQRNTEEAKRVAEAAQRKAEDDAKSAEAARRKAEEELDEVRRQLEAVRATSAAPRPTTVATTNVAPLPDTSITPAPDAVQAPHDKDAMCDPASAAAAIQGSVRPAAPARVTLIEEAEVYAASRGVVLLCKTENKESIVAPRSFRYQTENGVQLGVKQFHTSKAASRYRQAIEDVPLGGETFIQRGRILFSIWGATDAERRAVISALE
ncbi:hypothetical protein F0U60_37640 [Archangium minus]|uniref:Lipoprotein n=1 Tax=Archangium minus TaxID=83450 RepID=A0ABY9X1F9_9BACT|nr:hypothetical protein F0U60_37640 [Archangium minus]